MARFQYQGLAEPIQFTAPGETVTLDKWYCQQPSAPRSRTSPLNAGPFLHDPTNFGESILVDKWFQRASEPTRRGRVPPVGELVLPFTAALAVAVEQIYGWDSPPAHLVRRQRGSPAEGGVWAPLEPSLHLTPSMDTWWQAPPGPMRARRQSPPAEQFFVPVVAPTVDVWWFYAPDPIRLKAKPQPTEQAFSPLVDITIDAWWQPASEPVKVVQLWPFGGETKPLEPSLFVVPLVSTWWVQASEPTRPPIVWPAGGVTYPLDTSAGGPAPSTFAPSDQVFRVPFPGDTFVIPFPGDTFRVPS